MLKNAFITIGTRGLIVIVNFLTAIISARYLGAEGRGIISLFTLNMNVIMMFSFFVGGAGLVYLYPRYEPNKLFYASILWATCCVLTVTPLLGLFSTDVFQHFAALIFVAWLQSVFRVISTFILSVQRIGQFNMLSVIYPLTTIGTMLLFFEGFGIHTPEAFMIAMITGTLISVLAGLWIMRNEKALIPVFSLKSALVHALRYGFVVQLGNIVQLLNYRLSFYLLDYFYGKSALGIFSMAVSFAEVMWIIATSFAVNLYSRISNSADEQTNIQTSLRGMRISLALTLAPCIILCLLPASLFAFVLGHEFENITRVFPLLIPGIWIMTINISLVNFFTGMGHKWVSVICSVWGLAAMLMASLMLIPGFGLKGAAAASSFSYLASVISILYYFRRHHAFAWRDFIIGPKDWKPAALS